LPRFRTIQVCPKDMTIRLRQVELTRKRLQGRWRLPLAPGPGANKPLADGGRQNGRFRGVPAAGPAMCEARNWVLCTQRCRRSDGACVGLSCSEPRVESAVSCATASNTGRYGCRFRGLVLRYAPAAAAGSRTARASRLLANMRMLDDKDVVCLLRSEVERAGGQSAWARREWIDRTLVKRVLCGQKLPTKVPADNGPPGSSRE
jgi:hypothetical protein